MGVETGAEGQVLCSASVQPTLDEMRYDEQEI